MAERLGALDDDAEGACDGVVLSPSEEEEEADAEERSDLSLAFGVFVSLLKINWGIGMMTMPFYLKLVGVLPGVPFFVFSISLGVVGCERVQRCCIWCESETDADSDGDGAVALLDEGPTPRTPRKRERPRTFAAMMRNCTSPTVETLSIVCIFVASFGACIGYVIFIADTCAHFAGGIRWLWAWGAVLVVTPVCAVTKSVRRLEASGSVGLGLGVAFSLMIIFKTATSFESAEAFGRALAQARVPTHRFWDRIPVASGLAAFCNEGAVYLMPAVRVSLLGGNDHGPSTLNKERTLRTVLYSAMAVFIVVYMVVAMCGVALYGNDTEGDLTLNLKRGDAVDKVAALAYAAQILPTFLIVAFATFEIAEDYAANRCFQVTLDTFRGDRAGLVIAYRTAYCVLAGLIALTVPNFADFLSLVGASMTATIIFVFPHLAFLVTHPTASACDRALSIFSIGFGAVAAVTGTVASLNALLKSSS